LQTQKHEKTNRKIKNEMTTSDYNAIAGYRQATSHIARPLSKHFKFKTCALICKSLAVFWNFG